MGEINRPLLRYHGGKWRLSSWIIRFFPRHRIYVEPFGGAASVLLQKPKSAVEVYNDLDCEVVNLFQVLRDRELADRLFYQIMLTPYSRVEFLSAWGKTDDPVEKARRTIIRAQMGFCSAGATKGSTGFRSDSSRSYTTAMDDWYRYPACLPPIIDRLRSVQIENRDALAVIEQHDSAETLFYIDPPYMHGTRVMNGSTQYYQHEMTDGDHVRLLDMVSKLKGMVILSGYHSDLYDDALVGWGRFEKKSAAAAHRGTAMRTEVLWINEACMLSAGQMSLFDDVQYGTSC